jgi:hypothetical protein
MAKLTPIMRVLVTHQFNIFGKRRRRSWRKEKK